MPAPEADPFALELIGRIVGGQLAPGGALTDVPDGALAAIAARGLCDPLPGGVVVVAERYRWNVLDPDVVRAILATGDDERAADLIGETLDALRMLECSAARFAALRVTPAHRDRLQRLLAELQQQISDERRIEEGFLAARTAVYRGITRASGNQPLTAATAPLLAAFETFGFAGANAYEAATADPLELELVIDAILAGDGRRAASTMGAHLRRLNKRLGGTVQ